MRPNAKVVKKRTVRKVKPSKLTYKEILGRVLEHDLLIEEDRLLSEVVYKKYGTKRARKSRKLAAKLKLKEGESAGEFRETTISNMKFWRLGDGTASKNDDVLIYEARAREAAAHLEEFLLKLCKKKLTDAMNVVIPHRIENDLLERYKHSNQDMTGKTKVDFLKYASINDLGWIITENWNYFESIFKNKGDFVSKIKELNAYRMRLAHPNIDPMDDEEMEYFASAVKIFIKDNPS